jgi:DNA-binding transcriptional regulator YiaG
VQTKASRAYGNTLLSVTGVGTEQWEVRALSISHFSPTRIKELREAAGLSRTALAYLVGRSEQMVWRWENGWHTPPAPTLERLANALECSVGDLFEEDGAE